MTSRAFAAVALILLAMLPSRLPAADSATDLQTQLQALEAVLGEPGALTEADLPAARQMLQQARQSIDRLRAASDLEKDAAARIRALEASATRDVAASHAAWLRRQSTGAPRSDLETALADARARITEQRQTLATARAQLGSGELSESQSARLAELGAALDQLSRLPAPLPPRQAIDRLAAEAETAAIQRERATAELRWRQAQAQLGAAQTEIAELELRIAALQERIAGSDQRDVAALLDDLRRTRDSIDDPFLSSVAAGTLALGDRLGEQIGRLADERQAERQAELAREQASRSLSAVQSRIGIDAAGESLGALLLAELRSLEKPERLQARISELRGEIARARLRLLELPRDAEWPVRREDADDEPASPEAAAAEDGIALRLRSVMRGQRQAVQLRLGDTLQRRLDSLARTEAALHRQLDDTRTLQRLIDQQLLWLPSHAAIGSAWWSTLAASFADLWAPHRWQRAGALLLARAAERPISIGLGLAAVLALLLGRPGMLRRIEAQAPPRRHNGDRYALTSIALGWTVLASLPWPLLLGLLGYHWARAGDPGRFSHSLGLALGGLAITLLLFSVLHTLVRERGLAHLHFRWTRTRRESLAWHLMPTSLVVLALEFHILLAFNRGIDLAIDGAARSAAIAFALLAAGLLWRGLGAGRWWTPRGRSEPFRLRRALRIALPLACVALTVLLVQGYVFSAAVLLSCLWQSLWLVLAVALVHGMLARWMLLGERRLAQHRLQQQREAALAEGERSVDEAPEISDELISVEAVSAQTSRLLRALTLTLWIAGLLWIWADVYPALDRLDSQPVWQFSDVDDQGQAIRGAVTLRALILGLFTLAMTWVAARNLPGLLELGLRSRGRVDAASRYAIASVSRYAILVAGAMLGLSLLGMRWSQLQWMAAGFSVGLGFGLQEIFGNFVSGLILLFERPFRVGDVITIGEYTGTVAKIRTRATTLVDFDNKEVVIPNKAFITDRLINWTLSDTRTRIIIKVGVAYGSDIEQVHRLLRQAAAEQPAVLADPAPASWFLAFGASSLDFELRVFVDAMADRMPTTDALNTRIAALFAAHGIEIAFPQLDLHVRDLPRRDNGAAPAGSPAGG